MSEETLTSTVAEIVKPHGAARREQRRALTRLFLPLAAAAAIVLLMSLWFWLADTPPARATIAPVLMLGSAAVLGLVWRAHARIDAWAVKPAAALEDAAVAAQRDGPAAISGLRDPGLLTNAIRELATALETASAAPAPADAERGVRNWLETVLRDLHDGLIICTLDHRILLYNRQALKLLHVSGDIGLNRPLFTIMAPQPFRHAVTRLTARFRHGRHEDHEDGLSTMLVATTADGRYTMRGRLSLILDDSEIDPAGYVLTFADVTNDLAAALWHERAIFDLTDSLSMRAGHLAAAAADHEIPDALIADTAALAEEMGRLEDLTKDVLASAWPMSAVFSTTLFDCVRDRDSEERGLVFDIAGDPVWVRCDSATVTDLLDRLANRIAVHADIAHFETVATRGAGDKGFVDLIHDGARIDDDTLSDWLAEPLDPDLGSLTGADVVHSHRATLTSTEVEPGRARLRLVLSLSMDRYARADKAVMALPQRQEFYDFQLIHQREADAFDTRKLRDLTCVVFDTETTGLEPSNGDEIISIGAVRIVNGRLLRGEIFNEFVNPGRKIPPASTRVHGITDLMVADAPDILTTLPRFHGFIGDGVVIAHNAAFDMKFLSLKEEPAGVRFTNPVLDTLLLAAHALGQGDGLSLDALAERFGITLSLEDRHTALGDALATAEVFLKLVPILESRNVHTLGDAIAVSERQFGIRRMQANF
ncbi:MAG: exonuclease domain-containing protein [Pseudomonadota bacterium]